MSTVVALGDDDRLQGFALAGATVVTATTDSDLRAAWDALDAEVGLVIMSTRVAEVLAPVLDERTDLLTAVLP
jgi:vacuolar-type H+-ATPase subunit F/Vma7